MNGIITRDDINIENMIYEIRGVHVMLSSDVAKLYQVETKVLNQTIKRNINRFPESFCFRLTNQEIDELSLRSQFVTLNKKNNLRGQHYKYLPYVLTEQGIMMLSGLLKSDIAIIVNVEIIDAFVKMKRFFREINNNNNILVNHENRLLVLEDSFKKFDEKIKTEFIFCNGQIYDAYSKIIDIFKSSKKQLIIIDTYADIKVLDMIKNLTNIKVTIICSNKYMNKDIINTYNKQYNNLKVIINNSFHDRYFIIDNKIIYHCGSSINRIGYKTFGINIIEDIEVKELLIKKINEII